MTVEITRDDLNNTVLKIEAETNPKQNMKAFEDKPRTLDELVRIAQDRVYEVEEQAILQGALLFAHKEIKRLEENADKRLKQKNRKLQEEINEAIADKAAANSALDEVQKALGKMSFIVQKQQQNMLRIK
jgi:hypothetical protein